MKNRKGRPTSLTVSVMDNTTNAIIYTGSITNFVEKNFKYCSDLQKKNAKSALYASMSKGISAFDGRVRVFKNLENF